MPVENVIFILKDWLWYEINLLALYTAVFIAFDAGVWTRSTTVRVVFAMLCLSLSAGQHTPHPKMRMRVGGMRQGG